MSSDADHVVHNTRERVLSTKLNRGGDLLARMVLEALHASHTTGGNRSGVVTGLSVAVAGGSMDAVVSSGLALLDDAAASYPDSRHRWIELTASQAVTIPAADPASPRWDVIEIAPGTTTTSQLRDIFDPSTGTFTPTNVTDEVASAPTITVRSGTPSAAPVLPNGIAGVLPLAYVYVPAAAASLTAGDSIGCRPMLQTPRSEGRAVVMGGGVGVPATSGSVVRVHECGALLPGLPFEIGISDASGFDISEPNDPMWLDGEAYPAGSTATPLYLYAAAAPYPTGYSSTLAPREFRPGANIGPGGRIASVPAAIADAVRDCIVVATLTAPSSLADLQGDEVEGEAVNDPVWGDGVLGPGVYLGACTYASAGNLIGLQDYHGNGEVRWRPLTTADIPQDSSVLNGATDLANAGDWKREDPLAAAGDTPVPATAIAGHVRLSLSAAAPTVQRSISILEAGGFTQFVRDGLANEATDVLLFWLHNADGSGGFTWDHSETSGSGNSTLAMSVLGYRDAVLARR